MKHIIRIYGEPRPHPKDKIGYRKCRGQAVPMMISDDFRTRKNPATGKAESYDRGYKRRWMDHVRHSVIEYMHEHELKPYGKHVPLAIGCLFFISQAESNSMEFPAMRPDLDNYEYAIWNALKRTPAKRVKNRLCPGPYPDGVLFYDDDQIHWRLHPSGALWATEEHQPGVIIQIQPCEEIRDEIYSRVESVTGLPYRRQLSIV